MTDETKTVLEVTTVGAHASVSSVVSHFCHLSGRKVTRFPEKAKRMGCDVIFFHQDVDDPFYVVNLGTVIKKFVEVYTSTSFTEQL
jgi:hypothetical protein